MHQVASPSTMKHESDTSYLVISDEEKEVESDSNYSDHVDVDFELGIIVEQRCRSKTKNIMKNRQLTMIFHHGKLQVLPPRWKFPKMDAKKLMDNWYVGNAREHIPPLSLLTHQNVAHLGSAKTPNLGKVKLRQMLLVMSLIEGYARIEQCYQADKKK